MNDFTMAIMMGAELEDLLALAGITEEEFREKEEE